MKFFATVCLRRNGYIQMSPNIWQNPIEEKRIIREKDNSWSYYEKNIKTHNKLFMKDLVECLQELGIVKIFGNPTNSIEGFLLINGAIKTSTKIWEFPEKNLKVKYMNCVWELRNYETNKLISKLSTKQIKEVLKNTFGMKE